jgi:hypothetical protein
MKRTHYVSVLVAALSAGALGGTACSSPAGAEATGSGAQAASSDNCSWWSHERAARQAVVDKFLATNATAFQSFKDTPLGNLGVPMIMLRVFPEIFPEIWGQPSENFAPVGFAADPYETRALPLGLGFAGSTPAVQTPAGPININVVTLTCMGCHGGRVQGPDGVVHTVPGAPNTQFDGFRTAVYNTVNDPRYTVANFRAALNAHPLGWVYGDPTLGQQEAIERAIFNTDVPAGAPAGTLSPADQMLLQLQAGSNFGARRFGATLGTYTYAPQGANAPDPGGHTPGYLDAIGAGISIVVDPTVLTNPADLQAALPPAPAMIDIMSVWTQSERPAAQWDGSIKNHLHRNLAAEFGVIGDPTHLSMQNADLTTPFTDAMPSPPYPFDVQTDAAARGQHLYNHYCASCHTANNATIFSTATVGTDPNRANIWKPYSVGALRQVLRLACTDTVTCNQADGSPLPDTDIVNPTGGYMALPLDGIWARAPYLHNGSVPTLAALLTGDRPAQFYRGNVTYDEKNVGFTSDTATSPYAAIYDTTKSGNSNVGHSSAAFTGGIDWKANPGKLADLLEYLKTL